MMKIPLVPPAGATQQYLKDLSAAIEAALASLSPYRQIPDGGAAGNVLAKVDARDYNVDWVSTVTVTAAGVALPAGSATAPSLTFTVDTNLGLFRSGTDLLGVTAAGEEVARLANAVIPFRVFDRSGSDSTRISIVTTANAERGYWGFPTASNNTMILRNVVGDTIEFRVSTNTTVAGVTVVGSDAVWFEADAIYHQGVISPAQLTANTDNWAPTSYLLNSVIRLSTDASRNLTGIAAPAAGGMRILLCNVGTTNNLVLVHDATSTAANRFLCPGSANYTLTPNSSIYIWYDATSSRWRVIR